MNRVLAAAAAIILALVPAAVTTPAHAADPGPEVWSARWAWEGPGVGQINQEESFVQTINCNVAITVETRTDQATRYHRAEDQWPGPNRGSAFPANQRIITVHDISKRPEGWLLLHSWTPAHEHMDLVRVVWRPACTADLDAHT